MTEDEKNSLARNHYEGILWRKMGRAVIEYLNWTGEKRAVVKFDPQGETCSHAVQYTNGMILKEDSI